MMGETAIYFIQASLLLAVLWFCVKFGVKKASNYKFSRRFLIFGMLLSTLLPFLNFPNHFFTQQQPIMNGIVWDVIQIGRSYDSSIEINYLAILYFVGFSVATLKLAISFIKLRQVYQKSTPKGSYRELPHSTMAFSFFMLIFIGENINAKDKKAILQHEKTHGKQKHSIELMLSKLLGIIFWFNPFVYKLHQQLVEIQEYEADALSCKDTEYYTNLLLQQHFQFFNQTIIHPFNAHHLKHRIMRLKEKTNKKANKTIVLIGLLTFGIIFIGKQYLHADNFKLQKTTPADKVLLQSDSVEKKIYDPKNLDKVASYAEGNSEIYKYLGEYIKYPADEKEAGVEGTIYLKCIINAEGDMTDIRVMRGVNEALDQAAIKGVRKLKKWKPAEKNGKKVTSYIFLPIEFKLDKEDVEK